MFSSLKDASYQSCITKEKSVSIACYILDTCSNFLDNPSEEVLTQIKEGQILRYSEIHKPQYYTSEFVPCKPDTKGAMKYDVHVALSYTSQQFGKLKSENPKLHDILGSIRKDISTYCSNRKSELVASIRKEKDRREGKVRQRAATLDFSEWCSSLADTIKARAKTAKARGDDTVSDAKVNAIIKALK